jgi:hypothetical protein
MSTLLFYSWGNGLQGSGDFTWRVSDCEELVGGYSQEMMGWSCGQKNSRSTSKIVPA